MSRLIDDIRRYGMTTFAEDEVMIRARDALVDQTRQGVPVLVADNVLRYWLQTYSDRAQAASALIAGQKSLPPFPEMFIEVRSPSTIIGREHPLLPLFPREIPAAWGAMLITVDHWETSDHHPGLGREVRDHLSKNLQNATLPDKRARFASLNPGDLEPLSDIRWSLVCYLIAQGGRYGEKTPTGPVGMATVFLTPEGTIARTVNNTPLIVGHNALKTLPGISITSFRSGVALLQPLLLGLGFLNSPSTSTVQIIPDDRIAAAYKGRAQWELSRYYLMLVNPNEQTRSDIGQGFPPSEGDQVATIKPGMFDDESRWVESGVLVVTPG